MVLSVLPDYFPGTKDQEWTINRDHEMKIYDNHISDVQYTVCGYDDGELANKRL